MIKRLALPVIAFVLAWALIGTAQQITNLPQGVPIWPLGSGSSGSGGGAPTDATYITQVADSGLSAEQALAALATGCLGSATTTGVVSARTITGTANEITLANGDCSGNPTVSLPTSIDLGGKTSFEIPNAAAPTVDAFGEIAGDNNLWDTGRGAVLAYDGTAATALVGVLVSDTPSDGQFPRWNTGGTITWETAGGGVTIGDTQVAFATAANTLGGEAAFIYSSANDRLSIVGASADFTRRLIIANTNASGAAVLSLDDDAGGGGSNAALIFKQGSGLSSYGGANSFNFYASGAGPFAWSLSDTVEYVMNAAAFSNTTSNSNDLGTTSLLWKNLYLGTALYLGQATGAGTQFVEAWEQSGDPTAPSANSVRMFAKDSGGGKTQLCARFATGAVQCFATEP